MWLFLSLVFLISTNAQLSPIGACVDQNPFNLNCDAYSSSYGDSEVWCYHLWNSNPVLTKFTNVCYYYCNQDSSAFPVDYYSSMSNYNCGALCNTVDTPCSGISECTDVRDNSGFCRDTSDPCLQITDCDPYVTDPCLYRGTGYECLPVSHNSTCTKCTHPCESIDTTCDPWITYTLCDETEGEGSCQMTDLPGYDGIKCSTCVPFPTNFPSFNPSRDPSRDPSAPSVNPSNPSSDPSAFPSMAPSSNPSGRSSDPSTFPSKAPTNNPSTSPSNNPSKSPTYVPSGSPTNNPSKSPTNNPSKSPTDIPSESPSDVPSESPTNNPSNSPTNNPTSIPTKGPTSQPSTVVRAWEDCIDETIQFSGGYMQLFIQFDATNRDMQIQMTAPKHIWFGIGFGANKMNKTITITISSVNGNMAVRARRLQYHLEGDVVPSVLDNIQTTTFASNRMVSILQSWAMNGLFDFSDFFDGNNCELSFIWAAGSDRVVLSDHGPNNRGSVTLWSCLCSEDPTKNPSSMPIGGSTDMPTARPTEAPIEDVDVESDASYVEWWFG
eukprot:973485_1